MPSQHIGTFLTTKEMESVELACKKANITRYKLFKDALKHECEAILKQQEKIENGKINGETERNGGRDNTANSEGRNKTDDRSDIEHFVEYLRTS
jgi:hypothetical protein